MGIVSRVQRGGKPPASPLGTSHPVADPPLLPADVVLARLSQRRARIQGSGPSWMATCPAHTDLTPSLAITETADGTLLLYCWAGCDTETVLAHLGLDFRDLFPSQEAKASGRRSGGGVDSRGGRGPDAVPTEVSADERRRLRAYLAERQAPRCALRRLAEALDLPVDAVRAVRPGYDPEECCWLMPERDGKGRLVGLVRRDPDGHQLAVAGSHRGLTIPSQPADTSGPLYLVEGASDALALVSVGAWAVGRPGAVASSNVKLWTAQLVERAIERCSDLEVIVVGDHDSAGLSGAGGLAGCLEVKLGRSIRVALPHAPHKDLREQVVAGAWETGLELMRGDDGPPRQKPDLIQRAFARAVNANVERRVHGKTRRAR